MLSSTRSRLIAAFLLVAAASGLVSIVAGRGLSRVAQRLNDVSDMRLPATALLGRIAYSSTEASRQISARLLWTSDGDEARARASGAAWQEANAKLTAARAAFDALALPLDERASWRALATEEDENQLAQAQIMSALDHNDYDAARHIQVDRLEPALVRADLAMEHLALLERDQVVVAQRAGADDEHAVSRWLTVVTALTVLASLGVGLLLTLWITRPLREATEALQRLARRDLRSRMRGEYQGDFAAVSAALNEAVGIIEAGVSQVAESSSHVANESAQIAAESRQVARGADEQAKAVEQTTQMLRELERSSREAAADAVKAAGVSVGLGEATDTIVQLMERTSRSMEDVRRSAKMSAAIVSEIDEIAFHTNLLALNAAVEAAHAGGSASGFTVIAHEVRALAQRAKAAATKTDTLLRDALGRVDDATVRSDEVSVALARSTSQVRDVQALAKQIAEHGVTQVKRLNSANQAMARIDAVTRSNVESASQSAHAAESLSAEAKRMLELTAAFHFTTDASASDANAELLPELSNVPAEPDFGPMQSRTIYALPNRRAELRGASGAQR